jgi:hypothetical protein
MTAAAARRQAPATNGASAPYRVGTGYDLYNMTDSVVRDVSPDWPVELGASDELGGRNYSTGAGGFFSSGENSESATRDSSPRKTR